jgi:abortive infection bacteriophage resistance protein
MSMTMLKPFSKPSLSISDQVALLEQRGMIIADRSAAEHALTHISYYRLRAYWYYFEIDPKNQAHLLRPGTTFEAVLALYEFDRHLRLIINDAVERIEVAARGSWAHYLAMVSGPHGYLDRNLYPQDPRYQKNLTSFRRKLDGPTIHLSRTIIALTAVLPYRLSGWRLKSCHSAYCRNGSVFWIAAPIGKRLRDR